MWSLSDMGDHLFNCFRAMYRDKLCTGMGPDKDPENFVRKTLTYIMNKYT
jgi:hypothetical protein